MSLLEGCTETCGWLAAVLAVFAWGTFGVPIKSNVNVDVNFFVMQSYKTIVCFVTSWLVILLGEPIRFSAWGIVSGLFWVPGASCGIYAIRNAGIAVAVGTWSSIQVVVSCVFGIIIFQEKVKDKAQTMLAFFILMMGLIGMSIYADPSNGKSSSTEYLPINLTEPLDPATEKSTLTRSSSSTGKKRKSKMSPKKSTSNKVLASKQDDLSVESVTPTVVAPLEIDDTSESVLEDDGKTLSKDRVICFGGRLVLTKRQLGVLGAVVNGAWGGLNLIPLHYAQRDQGMSGAGYVISYASGSMLVCILIWIGIFLYQYVKKGYSVTDAVDSLPKWHINELGVPGVLAGLLYSIGNFCSILAVSYLGQGVGFSFCQGQLLISGLWGVFYFQEIQGRETIMKWFVSAAVAITGIVYLSYQKGGGAVHR
ncbi:drug/metabolite transporter superfamily protein [Nitzschia inconspicua]|uniref:Drug/metabolite transporter superfamily protein n=1 Tax=Nitzschia inconspicua TaxID=303405 RepID=A0A9K3KMW7_9STRA|nr:drug/metabolite transporter superfamily protein [Nitzschia inconspicua]